MKPRNFPLPWGKFLTHVTAAQNTFFVPSQHHRRVKLVLFLIFKWCILFKWCRTVFQCYGNALFTFFFKRSDKSTNNNNALVTPTESWIAIDLKWRSFFHFLFTSSDFLQKFSLRKKIWECALTRAPPPPPRVARSKQTKKSKFIHEQFKKRPNSPNPTEGHILLTNLIK